MLRKADFAMPLLQLFRTALTILAALGIAACSSTGGTQSANWIGGPPPDAPPRAAVQPPFPNVYDVPRPRPARLMSDQERAQAETELKAARDKVNAQSGAVQSQPNDRNRQSEWR
jgi:hypothetical protein